MSADRDPRLDTAWRVHSTEAPSPSIDATILAAAHRAVASAPHATSKVPAATQAWAWWMPLAAAAAIGAMAIGVIQLMPHPHDDSAAIVSDTPADAPSGSRAKAREGAPIAAAPSQAPAASSVTPAAVPTPPAVAPMAAPPVPQAAQEVRKPVASQRDSPASHERADRSAAVSGKSEASRERAPTTADRLSRDARVTPPDPFPLQKTAPTPESMAGGVVPPPAASAPAPRLMHTDPPSDASRDAAAEAPAKRTERSNATGGLARREPLDGGRSSLAASADDAARQVADFVTRVRALRSAGRELEAAQALAALRTAIPDADRQLPADLQPWAATIPR